MPVSPIPPCTPSPSTSNQTKLPKLAGESTAYGASFVCGGTGGAVGGVVGEVTTTLVRSAPSVSAAPVNVATIVVEAPTGSGPMSAQFSVPSLALLSDAGTDDTYVRYAVS